MKVALFIWDQYVISLDAPGFHDVYLPVIMAVFLMLLKEKLKECQSVSASLLLCIITQYKYNSISIYFQLTACNKMCISVLD